MEIAKMTSKGQITIPIDLRREIFGEDTRKILIIKKEKSLLLKELPDENQEWQMIGCKDWMNDEDENLWQNFFKKDK